MASAEAAPDLKRIDEIIRNSRALWFVLNGALVFAGITLASVQDIAFFVTSERTQLPLVGIDVPVTYFFWAGALLIASFYIYFHLYLEQLWQALGEAPARIGGKLLSERIHPWIVADAALRFRDRLRKAEGEQRASRPRGMGVIGEIATIVLVWLFGLQIVAWFWWRSMPAHDPLMTGWLAIVLAATFWVFCKSAANGWAHLGNRAPQHRWRYAYFPVLMVVAGLTVVRTWIDPWEGKPRETVLSIFVCDEEQDERSFCWEHFEVRLDYLRPAPADLREAVLTEKPSGWRERHLAEAEFRVRWCRENTALKCVNPLSPARSAGWDVEQTRAFREVWREHRNAELSSLAKPDLRGKDLRGANLAGIAFEGGNLSNARLEGADLTSARLEGADLRQAEFEGADLGFTRLEGANLQEARLQHTRLNYARLEGADLRQAEFQHAKLIFARLEGANLQAAKLGGAILHDAVLEGADLRWARFEGAILYDAVLEGADLRWARFEGARFHDTVLEGADLSSATFFGTAELPLDLDDTNLTASRWDYTVLRFVSMSDIDMSALKNFDASFGDGSVILPPNHPRPCQWVGEVLTNEKFIGRWYGWLQANAFFAVISPPPHFWGYDPIPPPPGCGPAAGEDARPASDAMADDAPAD